MCVGVKPAQLSAYFLPPANTRLHPKNENRCATRCATNPKNKPKSPAATRTAIEVYCPRYMRITGTMAYLSSQPDKARHPIGFVSAS
jgi:hypothetical protein